MSISVNATSSSSHWHAASVETCPFRAFSIYIIPVVLLTLEDCQRAAKFVNLSIVFAPGNLIRYWNKPFSVIVHTRASCRRVSKLGIKNSKKEGYIFALFPGLVTHCRTGGHERLIF